MLRGIEGGMGWRKEKTAIGREEIERGGLMCLFGNDYHSWMYI